MLKLEEITYLGGQLLEINPDPVPKFRIIRDVLKVPKEETLYTHAKQEMLKSKWVRELEEEQWENGQRLIWN
jgi:hypothetical protein